MNLKDFFIATLEVYRKNLFSHHDKRCQYILNFIKNNESLENKDLNNIIENELQLLKYGTSNYAFNNESTHLTDYYNSEYGMSIKNRNYNDIIDSHYARAIFKIKAYASSFYNRDKYLCEGNPVKKNLNVGFIDTDGPNDFSGLFYDKILCLSDTPAINPENTSYYNKYKEISMAQSLEEEFRKKKQYCEITQASCESFSDIRKSDYTAKNIENTLTSYHLPQNRLEPRREYRQIDNTKIFEDMYETWDLIIGRHILCSCFNERTCGGLKPKKIQDFLIEISRCLRSVNPYAIAILSGSGPKPHFVYYKETIDKIKKAVTYFNAGNFFFKMKLYNQGTQSSSFKVIIYNDSFMNPYQ